MDAESTQLLLDRARDGDERAREALFRRCAHRLRRWARGRLPGPARDIADTEDLVQVTLLRAFNRFQDFQDRGQGSFMAYLRQILLNRVKEELRRAGTRPDVTERLDVPSPGAGASTELQQWQTLERYEQALAHLEARAREAIILRLEFDLSYPEIAEELPAPSPDAARMVVARALRQLARAMDEAGHGPS